MFATTEKDKLTQLPLLPFELARWSRPKVGVDCYAKVGKALYTVPWHHIGSELDAREGYRTVEFFRRGCGRQDLAAVRERAPLRLGRLPARKVAFFMSTPSGAAKQAGQLGEHGEGPGGGGCLEPRPLPAAPAQGVLRLADTARGPERLEAACRRAIEIGDPEYRTVKGILAAGHRERRGAKRRPMPPPTCTAR